MTGCRNRILFAASAVAVLTVSGCVIESPLAVRRFWADYNTLRAPAAFYEKTSRVPMDSARVRELRWMYNVGPHEPGRLVLTPVATIPPVGVGTNAASSAPATPPSPLPPQPGKLQTPPGAPSTAPVAEQPNAGRTANARDAWRFIH